MAGLGIGGSRLLHPGGCLALVTSAGHWPWGTTRYYYDGQNVIAEYTYTEPDEVPTETLARTYINGSQYIDERVVMRDHVGTAEAPAPRDYYYLHQELYSVAGLARANGSLAEACVYETYGQARIYSWPNEDLNRNGSADPVDLSHLSANKSGSGVATDKPYMDFDMDGDVDTDDERRLDADLDGLVDASADALEVDVSPAGNPFLFTGRPADHLRTVQVLGWGTERRRIQDNRNRVYDPKHGRWLQRDPIGQTPDEFGELYPFRQYKDGPCLYEYVRSCPTVYVDPSGLCTCERILDRLPAGNPARNQAFRLLTTGWELMAALTIGAEDAGFGQPSAATEIATKWGAQYTELFKCCVDTGCVILWGEPMVAHTFATRKWHFSSSEAYQVVAVALKLPADFAGINEITIAKMYLLHGNDPLNRVAMMNAAVKTKPGNNPPIKWAYPYALPLWKGKPCSLVPFVSCDPDGTRAPWPGTPVSNPLPSPKPWPTGIPKLN